MKRTYMAQRSFATALSLYLMGLASVPGHAQVDSIDLSGAGGLIQSRINSYFVAPRKVGEVQLAPATADNLKFHAFGLSALPVVTNEPFWINHDFSSMYNFTFKHSKIDDADTDQHAGTVSLFLDSQIGWSVKPGVKYSFASIDSAAGTANVRSVTPNLATGLELLHLVNNTNYDPRVERASLVLGGTFGYTDSEKVTLPSSPPAPSQTSGWVYGGVLGYSYFLLHSKDPTTDEGKYGALLLTITPAYTYLVNRIESLPSGAIVPTESGVFSLKCQLDYAVTPTIKVGAYGTWLHDVTQKVPAGQTAVYRDWAQFGGQFSAVISKGIKLSVGYAYEAFNSSYYTHSVSAAVDFYF